MTLSTLVQQLHVNDDIGDEYKAMKKALWKQIWRGDRKAEIYQVTSRSRTTQRTLDAFAIELRRAHARLVCKLIPSRPRKECRERELKNVLEFGAVEDTELEDGESASYDTGRRGDEVSSRLCSRTRDRKKVTRCGFTNSRHLPCCAAIGESVIVKVPT